MDEGKGDGRARQQRGAWRLVVLALLGGIVVGGVLLVMGQAIIQGRALVGNNEATGRALPSSTPGPLSPPVSLPAAYRTMVEEQIGSGLHVSAAQIRSELQAHPTEDLMSVAKTQGFALDRVAQIATNALQEASDQMVAAGQWTQSESEVTMRFWRQQQPWPLIAEMSRWFRDQTG